MPSRPSCLTLVLEKCNSHECGSWSESRSESSLIRDLASPLLRRSERLHLHHCGTQQAGTSSCTTPKSDNSYPSSLWALGSRSSSSAGISERHVQGSVQPCLQQGPTTSRRPADSTDSPQYATRYPGGQKRDQKRLLQAMTSQSKTTSRHFPC